MSDAEKKLASELLSLDQGHIFSKWADSGDEDKKHAFFEQVRCERGAMRRSPPRLQASQIISKRSIAQLPCRSKPSNWDTLVESRHMSTMPKTSWKAPRLELTHLRVSSPR